MLTVVGTSNRSTVRITKSTVEGLSRPAPGGRSVLWDAEVKGFGVRVTSSGMRTYVLRYQIGGRDAPQRQVTIGQHGSPYTADQARRRAVELLTLVRSGVDPLGERERAKDGAAADAERRAARMFNVLADRWVQRQVKATGMRSAKDIEGVIERDLKPAFAGLTVDEITREKVGDELEKIGNRSGAAANKSHKWLRRLFNWLIEKGVIEHSPVDRIKRPFPEGSRNRVLSLLEVVVMWVALDAMPDPFRTFYRLLILLGQRLREVANMPWSELDLEAGEWLIPAARTKNKIEHALPLSDQAIALLVAIKGNRAAPVGPVLTTDGRVGISGFSKMKEALDEHVATLLARHPEASANTGAALPDWVVHDLRRTLATGCQALGFPVEVTEAVLNHISGRMSGVRGIYQLYDYYDEKGEALARWGALVEQAVAAFRRADVAAVLALDPVRSARRTRRHRSGDFTAQPAT